MVYQTGPSIYTKRTLLGTTLQSRRNPNSLWLADAQGQHEGGRRGRAECEKQWLQAGQPLIVFVVFLNGDWTWFNQYLDIFDEQWLVDGYSVPYYPI